LADKVGPLRFKEEHEISLILENLAEGYYGRRLK
jgi:hypothetical protein